MLVSFCFGFAFVFNIFNIFLGVFVQLLCLRRCAGLPVDVIYDGEKGETGTPKYDKSLPKGKTETAAEKPSSDKSEIGRGRDSRGRSGDRGLAVWL